MSHIFHTTWIFIYLSLQNYHNICQSHFVFVFMNRFRNALALWVNVLFEILVLDHNHQCFTRMFYLHEDMRLNFWICPFLLFDTVRKTSQTCIRFTFKSLRWICIKYILCRIISCSFFSKIISHHFKTFFLIQDLFLLLLLLWHV